LESASLSLPLALAAASAAPAFAGVAGSAAALRNRHLRAGRQPELAVVDDFLARGQPARNDHLFTELPRDRDLTHFRSAILPDHVDELS